MKEFQRMMADCRAGNIYFILVKSISRLGRNTLQFLQACNELNDLGVDV
jgi:DNA invertase Pin-like site-specific DNA recombinase